MDFEDGCEERPNLSGNGKISYVDLKGLPDYRLKKKKKKKSTSTGVGGTNQK